MIHIKRGCFTLSKKALPIITDTAGLEKSTGFSRFVAG